MKLVFGTMNIGIQVEADSATDMINEFLERGYTEIDTAYVYNNGKCEEILGGILPEDRRKFSIATKVNPRVTGKLDRAAVMNQFSKSLERMKIDYVDLLYFHFPDKSTSVIEALEAINDLYVTGKIKEFGLSNFSASSVFDIHETCSKKGWLKPTVYQGMYNPLARMVESELLGTLSSLDISFYAYNPLAGGLLSGKYKSFNDSPIEGRFTVRPNYQKRYWKESYFQALNMLSTKCKEENIPLPEAAYRWLAFHSKMERDKNDAILIGASKMEQLRKNMDSIENGSLPQAIVGAFDKAWEFTSMDSPEYFRYVN